MTDYLTQHGTRATAQREQIRSDQVPNSEGGFVWAIDPLARLRRFLILGSEGGSFYAGERELTFQNVKCVHECVRTNGLATVAMIVDVSEGGLAPKNDPALFALAVAISHGDPATKSAAAEALPRVARIGTHLFHFVAYAETMRGWGPTLRWAVKNWYSPTLRWLDKNREWAIENWARGEDGQTNLTSQQLHDIRLRRLAYDAVKYPHRDAWGHRDLLRLAHPEHKDLFRWITHPESVPEGVELPDIVAGYIAAQTEAETPEDTAGFVRIYGLPREALRDEHKPHREVQAALLETGMPMTAMIRNLGNMTKSGLLESTEHRKLVVDALTNERKIRRARVHPVALLIALRTYASGHGYKGKGEWNPVPAVVDALNDAFYLAFDNVETTGQNILLGVDVSASMCGYWGGVGGSPLTAREAAAAMALVTLHAEPNVTVVGFDDRMHAVSFSPRQRLDDALARMPTTGNGTDCAIPVLYADQPKFRTFDAIVLYTDNETYAGRVHVSQAIRKYRDERGTPTRLVACGMVANEFTVCDPTDPLSLNVVGFDASAPGLISEFAAGTL